MKQISMMAILMALVLGGSISCTKDNSGTSSASTSSITNGTGKGGAVGDTRTILESGTWQITAFSDGQNSISYTGYTFNFSEDGTTTATYGGSMYPGSWATTAELQDLLFLNFGESQTLSSLNGEWQVLNISTNMIQFKQNNGKGSFTFEKL